MYEYTHELPNNFGFMKLEENLQISGRHSLVPSLYSRNENTAIALENPIKVKVYTNGSSIIPVPSLK